jgi:Protein of unknown function (DUF3987)
MSEIPEIEFIGPRQAFMNVAPEAPPLNEIQPLRRPIDPPEQYPIDELGEVISQSVKIVCDVLKVPDAMAAQSFLAGASLAVQGIANVKLHGGKIPLSEFFLTIAESGERKSAVDNIAKSAANHWQYEAQKEFRIEKKRFDSEMALFKQKEKTAFKKGDRFNEPEPIPPRNPLIICEDPTIEGLTKLLDEAMPSTGIFADEGGIWLGGFGMNSDNRLKTIGGLSKLWNGQPIDRVRSGDGVRVIYNRRCAIHLMVQPKIADSFLNDSACEDQGILSRFLTAYPQSTKGVRLYKNENVYNSVAIKNYSERVEKLLNRWQWDNETGELQLQTIKLSGSALQLWIQFHDHIEKQQTESGAYRPISSLASKSGEHVARLAAIMQIFDNQDSQWVESEYIERAINVMEFYLSEALRLKLSAVTPGEIINAEKLLNWFKEQKLTEIYPVKIYQEAPGALRTKKQATPILQLLEDHGYLVPVPDDQRIIIDGKPRKKTWRIAAYSVDEVLIK